VKIVCLPGDGIGVEVTAAAREVLAVLLPELELEERLFGGAAILATGSPFPDETRAACLAADAVLLGAVGLPQFDAADVRPEQGLIALRKELDVYANLRPARRGAVDLVVVRELVGGLYYGAKGTREDGTVFDTLEYHPTQVERIAHRAFAIARGRRRRVTSVDKANILETSRMWRRVVTEVSGGYPDVELEHMLVDSTAMQLITAPERFDVILTENTFGDILSDEAGALTGGLGLAASASLGDAGPGIFEPVHGSAPDIAGQGIANPIGAIWSGAQMLEHLGEAEAAAAVLDALERMLADGGPRTRDLGGNATTADVTSALVSSFA
jgi:3-isopropylmalate dehydrogenase